MNDVLHMYIMIILDINFDTWLKYERHLCVLAVENSVL